MGPLARRVAGRPNPLHYTEHVNELIDAVHAALRCVAAMIAKAEAQRRCAHLPLDERGRELRRLIDAAPRPRRPAIAPGAVAIRRLGNPLLTVHVKPFSGPLSALLANAAPDRRGWPTVSEQLEAALRLIDDAAGALHRKLKAGERSPAVARPRYVEPITQEQCRAARRAKLPFAWPAEFDLPGEISAICQPLAAAVAGLDDPATLAGPVNKVAEAVHESVSEIAAMVVHADAVRRCAHVHIDQRGLAKRMLLDLAVPPPARPTITAAQLVAGQWAGLLVEIAAPYREPLSELLRDSPLIDGEHVSERLEASLTRFDSAALTLTRRIGALARRGRDGDAQAAPATSPRDKARHELARLRVVPP